MEGEANVSVADMFLKTSAFKLSASKPHVRKRLVQTTLWKKSYNNSNAFEEKRRNVKLYVEESEDLCNSNLEGY